MIDGIAFLIFIFNILLYPFLILYKRIKKTSKLDPFYIIKGYHGWIQRVYYKKGDALVESMDEYFVEPLLIMDPTESKKRIKSEHKKKLLENYRKKIDTKK